MDTVIWREERLYGNALMSKRTGNILVTARSSMWLAQRVCAGECRRWAEKVDMGLKTMSPVEGSQAEQCRDPLCFP